MIPNAYVFCKIKPQTLVNGGHSQMKCIQCHKHIKDKVTWLSYAFKNQDYPPMFTLNKVCQEGTIPEY